MAVDYLNDIGGNVSDVGLAKLGETGTATRSSVSTSGDSLGSQGMSKVATAGKITGALLNAYATYSSLESQEYASKYNKALIDSERTIANTSFFLQKSRVEKLGKRLLSRQRAVISKSGLEFSGSPVDVMQASIEDIELDLFAIEYNRMISDSQHQTAIDRENIKQEKAKDMKIPAAISTFIGGIF